MEIKVTFYGVLADVTGMRMKTYTGIMSLADLEMRLADDFPGIRHYDFRIFRNSELLNRETALNDGDEIVLLPY